MKKPTLLLAGLVLAATAFAGTAEARPGRHVAYPRAHSQPQWGHSHRHSNGCGHRVSAPYRTHVRYYAPPVRYYPAPVTVYEPPVVYYDDYDPYWGFGFNSGGDVRFEFGW
jgi:hypothetical protein